MREPSRRDAVAVVAACLLHGAALATAAWLGPPLVRLVAPPITLTLELEPIVASEERAEERTADVVEDTEESPSRPVSARRSRVRVEPVAAVGSIGPSAPSGGSSEDVAREPSLLEPSLPRGAGPIDVDPRRLAPSEIARASVLAQVEGSIAPSQSGPSTLVVPRTETDAESRLTGHLRDRAMSKTYVTRRARVRLIPRPDGSLHYDGSAFDADIRPDGTVVFHDRDDATIDPTPRLGQTAPLTDVTGAQLDPPLFRDPPIAGLSVGGTFDGDSALARARGDDPHRFERERFLDETEELRGRLEDAAREADRARWRRAHPDAGAE
ncbi:MAG: hypothetical protein K1X94_16770 [Sandaracinaceae bacterium]|nr:hypothetical protein [Sandaracinaceae bacterium]